MTKIQQFLADLPEEKKALFVPVFGSMEKFYTVVSSYGLDGGEIVADIASDYFEDYVNYKEPELDITNDEFIAILQKI